ncbi:uncharacterized protein LOC111717829 isoform X2 [Eurytemora carolleeae]|uniref:uncharacterized protein LOC111717829 isoform X2 n=1 Tax=Eurytemora carolleeae TaxID=1294199 RepID=UPI000C781398|nr:uncharacterized protein LOC111717829 isoform X2 [Eurytemora carolleeae]|eukprot:XP_023349046.1 uncharacterized protein LOC111717829 isoform X2 [Eurytemora affinis]
MFVFQVEDTYVVLKSRLEGEKDHDCSILCSNSYNQFSRIQTAQALQTFFNIDKIEHAGVPESEYISFHEFLAFIFQNVCSLPSTPRTEAFLDSLINLSASILNRRRNFNSLEVLKPQAESLYHLKSYKRLLDNIVNLDPTTRTCTQCRKVLESLVELRTHMIIFHLGSDNWKLLQPGVAKELRCAPCSQQFYSVFEYLLHLNFCIGSRDLEKTAYIRRMREMKTLNISNSNFCHLCMITLPCRENFLKHLQVHDDGFDQDPHNLICRNPKCEKAAVYISSRKGG